VIGELPALAGAVKAIEAEAFPAVAVPIVGAPGALKLTDTESDPPPPPHALDIIGESNIAEISFNLLFERIAISPLQVTQIG
jgi:hypothetical protein